MRKAVYPRKSLQSQSSRGRLEISHAQHCCCFYQNMYMYLEGKKATITSPNSSYPLHPNHSRRPHHIHTSILSLTAQTIDSCIIVGGGGVIFTPVPPWNFSCRLRTEPSLNVTDGVSALIEFLGPTTAVVSCTESRREKDGRGKKAKQSYMNNVLI